MEDQSTSSTTEEHNKAAQCSVISTYQVKIGDNPRIITTQWSKNLINHSFTISIEKTTTNNASFTYKIDLKPWPFWGKKGFKTFDIDNNITCSLFWDLRSAKFCTSPEPSSGYYIALVYNQEVILLLGDFKKEAYKKTKSRPSLEDATLLTKRENVFGKKCFTTRAKFDDRKKEHDIVVENSISGPKEPEMWISVDGIVLVHVTNLQWKFRGNETVVVEQVPVQIFWDVHDWLFGSPGMTHGLFIFKPGQPQIIGESGTEGGGGGGGSPVHSRDNSGFVAESCFFLYAWKME